MSRLLANSTLTVPRRLAITSDAAKPFIHSGAKSFAASGGRFSRVNHDDKSMFQESWNEGFGRLAM